MKSKNCKNFNAADEAVVEEEAEGGGGGGGYLAEIENLNLAEIENLNFLVTN